MSTLSASPRSSRIWRRSDIKPPATSRLTVTEKPTATLRFERQHRQALRPQAIPHLGRDSADQPNGSPLDRRRGLRAGPRSGRDLHLTASAFSRSCRREVPLMRHQCSRRARIANHRLPSSNKRGTGKSNRRRQVAEVTHGIETQLLMPLPYPVISRGIPPFGHRVVTLSHSPARTRILAEHPSTGKGWRSS